MVKVKHRLFRCRVDVSGDGLAVSDVNVGSFLQLYDPRIKRGSALGVSGPRKVVTGVDLTAELIYIVLFRSLRNVSTINTSECESSSR